MYKIYQSKNILFSIAIAISTLSTSASANTGTPCLGETLPWPVRYADGSLCLPVLNMPNGDQHTSYYTRWTPEVQADGTSILKQQEATPYPNEITHTTTPPPIYYDPAIDNIEVYFPKDNMGTEKYYWISANPPSLRKQSAAERLLEDLTALIEGGSTTEPFATPCPGEIFPWPIKYSDGSLCLPAVNIPTAPAEYASFYTKWIPHQQPDGSSVLILNEATPYPVTIANNSIAEPVYYTPSTGSVEIYYYKDNKWIRENYAVGADQYLTLKIKPSLSDDISNEIVEAIKE